MSTKSWSTSFFLIRRVFQGDTFSPLVCFNLIVKLADSLKDEGFSLCLPVPNSEGLPPIESHFLVTVLTTQSALRCFAPSNFSKSQHSELIKRLARTSILCSHTIFTAWRLVNRTLINQFKVYSLSTHCC